jgi:hypothetical protein
VWVLESLVLKWKRFWYTLTEEAILWRNTVLFRCSYGTFVITWWNVSSVYYNFSSIQCFMPTFIVISSIFHVLIIPAQHCMTKPVQCYVMLSVSRQFVQWNLKCVSVYKNTSSSNLYKVWGVFLVFFFTFSISQQASVSLMVGGFMKDELWGIRKKAHKVSMK